MRWKVKQDSVALQKLNKSKSREGRPMTVATISRLFNTRLEN